MIPQSPFRIYHINLFSASPSLHMASLSINDTFVTQEDLSAAINIHASDQSFKLNKPFLRQKVITYTCIGKSAFQCDAFYQAILRKKDSLWVLKKIKDQHKCPPSIHEIGVDKFVFDLVKSVLNELKGKLGDSEFFVPRIGWMVNVLGERGFKINYEAVFNSYKLICGSVDNLSVYEDNSELNDENVPEKDKKGVDNNSLSVKKNYNDVVSTTKNKKVAVKNSKSIDLKNTSIQNNKEMIKNNSNLDLKDSNYEDGIEIESNKNPRTELNVSFDSELLEGTNNKSFKDESNFKEKNFCINKSEINSINSMQNSEIENVPKNNYTYITDDENNSNENTIDSLSLPKKRELNDIIQIDRVPESKDIIDIKKDLLDNYYKNFLNEFTVLNNNQDFKIFTDNNYIYLQFDALKDIVRNVLEVKVVDSTEGCIIYGIVFDPCDNPILYSILSCKIEGCDDEVIIPETIKKETPRSKGNKKNKKGNPIKIDENNKNTKVKSNKKIGKTKNNNCKTFSSNSNDENELKNLNPKLRNIEDCLKLFFSHIDLKYFYIITDLNKNVIDSLESLIEKEVYKIGLIIKTRSLLKEFYKVEKSRYLVEKLFGICNNAYKKLEEKKINESNMNSDLFDNNLTINSNLSSTTLNNNTLNNNSSLYNLSNENLKNNHLGIDLNNLSFTNLENNDNCKNNSLGVNSNNPSLNNLENNYNLSNDNCKNDNSLNNLGSNFNLSNDNCKNDNSLNNFNLNNEDSNNNILETNSNLYNFNNVKDKTKFNKSTNLLSINENLDISDLFKQKESMIMNNDFSASIDFSIQKEINEGNFIDKKTYEKIISIVKGIYPLKEERFINKYNLFNLQNAYDSETVFENTLPPCLPFLEVFDSVITSLKKNTQPIKDQSIPRYNFSYKVRSIVEKNKKIAEGFKIKKVEQETNLKNEVNPRDFTIIKNIKDNIEPSDKRDSDLNDNNVDLLKMKKIEENNFLDEERKDINQANEHEPKKESKITVISDCKRMEFTVDLINMKCTCGKFQNLLIPCVHACAVVNNPYDYVSVVYSKDLFTFEHNVKPVLKIIEEQQNQAKPKSRSYKKRKTKGRTH